MQEPLFNVVPVQLAETVTNGVLTFYGPAITDDMTDSHVDLVRQEFQIALGYDARRYVITRDRNGKDWVLAMHNRTATATVRKFPSLGMAQAHAMQEEWMYRTPEERGEAPSDIYELSDRVANPEAYEQYM